MAARLRDHVIVAWMYYKNWIKDWQYGKTKSHRLKLFFSMRHTTSIIHHNNQFSDFQLWSFRYIYKMIHA